MEFDKNNFKDSLKGIKQLIDDCDFIAFDTELTGLHCLNTHCFQSSNERYRHLRDHSVKYAVTQFGICVFKYVSEGDKIVYAPLNFHLLPQAKSEKDNFTVNIDTVQFLNKHKFDYNKTLRDGISSVRLSERIDKEVRDARRMDYEMEMIEKSVGGAGDGVEGEDCPDTLVEACRAFLADASKEEMVYTEPLSQYEQHCVATALACRVGSVAGQWALPVCDYDASLRRVTVRVRKCSDIEAGMKALVAERHRRRAEERQGQLMFSEVIAYLCAAGKVLVGHNCLLDIVHTYDKFIGPLPEELQQFKAAFHSLVPRCIDTKFLTKTLPSPLSNLQHNNLQSLYESSKALPRTLNYTAQTEAYQFPEESQFHTAHYDAMITGMLFLNVCSNLCETAFPGNLRGDEAARALSPYMNKFNVVGSDLACIDLAPTSTEATSPRTRLLKLTVPPHWRKNDVLVCLASLIHRPLKDVFDTARLAWIDSVSVLTRLPDNIDPSTVPTGTHGDISIERVDPEKHEDHSEMEEGGFTMAKQRKRRKVAK